MCARQPSRVSPDASVPTRQPSLVSPNEQCVSCVLHGESYPPAKGPRGFACLSAQVAVVSVQEAIKRKNSGASGSPCSVPRGRRTRGVLSKVVVWWRRASASAFRSWERHEIFAQNSGRVTHLKDTAVRRAAGGAQRTCRARGAFPSGFRLSEGPQSPHSLRKVAENAREGNHLYNENRRFGPWVRP